MSPQRALPTGAVLRRLGLLAAVAALASCAAPVPPAPEIPLDERLVQETVPTGAPEDGALFLIPGGDLDSALATARARLEAAGHAPPATRRERDRAELVGTARGAGLADCGTLRPSTAQGAAFPGTAPVAVYPSLTAGALQLLRREAEVETDYVILVQPVLGGGYAAGIEERHRIDVALFTADRATPLGSASLAFDGSGEGQGTTMRCRSARALRALLAAPAGG